jgi:hypothetical protein
MTWNGELIMTSFEYPPIPVRNLDWAAWIDGREEGPIGRAHSEHQAIANLLEQLTQ